MFIYIWLSGVWLLDPSARSLHKVLEGPSIFRFGSNNVRTNTEFWSTFRCFDNKRLLHGLLLSISWYFRRPTLHFKNEKVSANLCQCQNSFVTAGWIKTNLAVIPKTIKKGLFQKTKSVKPECKKVCLRHVDVDGNEIYLYCDRSASRVPSPEQRTSLTALTKTGMGSWPWKSLWRAILSWWLTLEKYLALEVQILNWPRLIIRV